MLNEEIKKKKLKKHKKDNPSQFVLTCQTCDPNYETTIT